MGVTDTRIRDDGTQRRSRKCATCGEKTITLEIDEQRYKRLVKLEEANVDGFPKTMIDKVACALIEADPTMFGYHESHISSKRDGARAVIAAMREPTKEMITGEGMHWDYSCQVCGGWKEGWYAMIDAALGKVTNEQP